MMQISEFSFPHLHAAHDERLTIELERRRVAAERRAETAAPRPTSAWLRFGRRSGAAVREPAVRPAGGILRAEPCPTCP
ncbi:hypothetical protein ACFQ58_04275 [Agromyces sp. NPDC056523]|uniref:hypothetical protein n=1 Tax=Agromyces sp. NPDC056523 TaxID=3345850 RepID=UPI00366BDFA0